MNAAIPLSDHQSIALIERSLDAGRFTGEELRELQRRMSNARDLAAALVDAGHLDDAESEQRVVQEGDECARALRLGLLRSSVAVPPADAVVLRQALDVHISHLNHMRHLNRLRSRRL